MNLTHLRTLITEGVEGHPIVTALFALARDSLVYLAGTAMIGLSNFILLPLYTRYLTPAEFGVYALVEITVLILVAVTQLGFRASYLKWFADTKPSRRGELLGSTLIVGALAAAIGGGLLTLAVASPLGKQWLQTATGSLAWMLLPIVLFENLQGLLLTDLQARRQAVAFSVSAVARLLAIVGASLWFLGVKKQGVAGIFLGRLFGDGTSVALLAAFCFRSTAPRFAWPIVVPMLRYGLPLVWSALTAMMLDASGRYFLGHYGTVEQVGLYGVGVKISNIMQVIVVQPFGTAWGGLMFQIAHWPNARLIYSRTLSYAFIVAMTVAAVMMIFSPGLLAVFTTPAYAPAIAVTPWLLLPHALRILEYWACLGLYLTKRTTWVAATYSAGLMINLLANWFLVPRYGMFGAAVAWVVSLILIIGIMAWLANRCYPLPYIGRYLLGGLGIWFFSMVVIYSTPMSVTLPDLLISGMVSLAMLIGVGIFFYWDFQIQGPR